jgi:hypothetical protein
MVVKIMFATRRGDELINWSGKKRKRGEKTKVKGETEREKRASL